MKTILVVFDNDEHERLSQLKGEMSWHDFIMQLIKKEVVKNAK